MCGICGEWNSEGVDPLRLAEMNLTLKHRGPDDSGQVELGQVGLAMRRLSIIDLERGHQPLHNEDQTVWIVFNGEIYNYKELRRDLLQRGHRFTTATDTETIIHLYEEKGDRVVDDLRGMFAFAIWDSRRRRLLLARDRFGQKPLFYYHDNTRLVFASEIKAVLAALDKKPSLDFGALDDYLTLRFVPSPDTMFVGVQKLPPGHVLTFDADGSRRVPKLETRRYWNLRYLPKQRVSEPEAIEELRERLLETVESHLVADVPVGSLLSGGMDSSLIVALMTEIMDQPVATFAIGVKQQDFDELPFAREVAGHCKTEHHEEMVWPDLLRLLPHMIHHLDEPSDPIAACFYHAAVLAARHRKVILTGDGGDEIFAGFDRYYGFGWVGPYAAVPETFRRNVVGPLLRRAPDSAGYKNTTQKARWLHELSFHNGGRRYAQATAFFRFDGDSKEPFYSADTSRRLSGRDPAACIVKAFDEAEADNDLDRMLYADTVTRLPEHSLMLTDRMAMAHGMETRAPFLDHRLAEYVATLPAGLKLRRRQLKYMMRKVGERYLPQGICRRPKQGFMFPVGYWMKGPLAQVCRRLISDLALVDAGILRREPISQLLDEHLASVADHHVRLWLILSLEVWYRMYFADQSAEQIQELFESCLGDAGANGKRLIPNSREKGIPPFEGRP